jgi:hypothetical protein
MAEKQQVTVNIPVVLATWQRFEGLAAAKGIPVPELLHRLLVRELCTSKLTDIQKSNN